MESRVEDILKGRVETTTDYDNTRKIIGVGDASVQNLTKQGAFIKEEPKVEAFEEISALDSINNEVSETLDFGAKIEPASEEVLTEPAGPRFILPEAEVSDTISGVPVDVASTDSLETLSPETPGALEVRTEVPTEEEKIDLQLPTMEEVSPAGEPAYGDQSLFESVVAPKVEESTPSTVVEEEKEVPEVTEEIKEADISTDTDNEKINKMLDDLKEAITKAINDAFDNYKASINEKDKKSIETEGLNEESVLNIPKTTDSPSDIPSPENIYEAAMSQIDRMAGRVDEKMTSLQ